MKELSKRDKETATRAAWCVVALPCFVGFGIATAILNTSDAVLHYCSISVAGLAVLSCVYFFPKVWKVNTKIKSNRVSVGTDPESNNFAIEKRGANLTRAIAISLFVGPFMSILFFGRPLGGGMVEMFGTVALFLLASMILEVQVQGILKSWGVTT